MGEKPSTEETVNLGQSVGLLLTGTCAGTNPHEWCYQGLGAVRSFLLFGGFQVRTWRRSLHDFHFRQVKLSRSLKGTNPHWSINSRNIQEAFVWAEYENIRIGFHVRCVTLCLARPHNVTVSIQFNRGSVKDVKNAKLDKMSNKLNPEIHGFRWNYNCWPSLAQLFFPRLWSWGGGRGRIYVQWRGTVWEMNFRQVKTRAWRKN